MFVGVGVRLHGKKFDGACVPLKQRLNAPLFAAPLEIPLKLHFIVGGSVNVGGGNAEVFVQGQGERFDLVEPCGVVGLALALSLPARLKQA